MPNNPWHMMEYINEILGQMRAKVENDEEGSSNETIEAINAMQQNLDKLKPVVDAHDKDYQNLQVREQEMERLLHEFKNSLMIEKIKMDTWENKQKFKNN
jgi:hypothetical protein